VHARYRGGVIYSFVVACLVCGARPAHASAFTFADLLVDNLTLTPINGTVNFSPYSVSAIAKAQNSLGESDAQASGAGLVVAANAAVTSAHANANGNATRWQATSVVTLSSGVDESAFSAGHSDWAADFTISCPTNFCGPFTEVGFSALLHQQLFVQTDSVGLLAQDQLILSLQLNGFSVFFYNPQLSTGPNGLDSQNGLFQLSNVLTLSYDTPYSLALRVDSVSNGQTVVPEPSTFALFALGAAAFRLTRTRRRP
jgi:PEP-CTERM motif